MAELCDPIADILSQEKVLFFVLDIDDTIATPEHELGSNRWFCHELEQRQAQPGADKTKALHDIVALYTHVHNYIPLKAVEENTPLFIILLQSLDIPCMALTARSQLVERTFEQLSPIGIDFTLSAPSKEDINLSDNPELPARYSRGILFNGDNNKGEMLVNYFKTIGVTPDYVIYVDDSLSHVKKVDAALEAAGIPCTAYHYRFMESINATFDMTKADQQLEVFLKKHPFTQTNV